MKPFSSLTASEKTIELLRWLLVPVFALAACSKSDEANAPTTRLDDKPAITTNSTAKKAPPKPAALTKVTIKALGMYCEESCPLKVRYALADVPAVYELGFDVSTESIFVS